jgi:predicted component of type VI protein secretion system
MEVKLIVTNGKQTGKEIPVAGPKFVIGRGEGCRLRPQCTEVSRKHCAILIEEGVAFLEDCGSTNGTFLNGERIAERHKLKDGDHVRVGLLEMNVRLTIGVGGEKKPVVHSVQEAAARTLASASAREDIDISGWLGDESTLDLAPTRETPPSTHDTLAGTGLGDTAAISARRLDLAPEKKPEPAAEKKPDDKKKVPSPKCAEKKGPLPAKPLTADSGTAADDALRRFLHRKK